MASVGVNASSLFISLNVNLTSRLSLSCKPRQERLTGSSWEFDANSLP